MAGDGPRLGLQARQGAAERRAAPGAERREGLADEPALPLAPRKRARLLAHQWPALVRSLAVDAGNGCWQAAGSWGRQH
jgi:hypothetical protein